MRLKHKLVIEGNDNPFAKSKKVGRSSFKVRSSNVTSAASTDSEEAV